MTHHLHDGLPGCSIGMPRFDIVRTRWGRRHDLSPEEASQVVRFLVGEVPVGDHQVLPSIVVQIGED